MTHSAPAKTSEAEGQKRAGSMASATNTPDVPVAPVTDILFLQRAIGNRALNHIIQAKLTVSTPGDRYEQEADRVAEQILKGPQTIATQPSSGLPKLQKKCACASGAQRCDSCASEEKVQLKPAAANSTHHQVSKQHGGTGLGRHVNLLRGGGQPLSKPEREFYEPRFGRDLSNVRIHADAAASESARSLRAHAFTTGNHIVFASGRYGSQTAEARRLLAHELVHVVQQSGVGPATIIQREPDDAPVHAPATGGNLAALNNVPHEKWSEGIEQQYRRRGDIVRANAIRDCRTKGGDACAILLTATETMRLHALAQSSGGDENKIRVGMAGAAPLLAPRVLPTLARTAPLLRLVPMPPPVPAPVAGGLATGVAAAGIAAIVIICVIAAIELWELGKFQEALRGKGFIILEDPLGLCISGCHMPSKAGPPLPLADRFPLPPLTGPQIEDWLPKGSQKSPQQPAPQPAPVPDVGPQPAPRRHPDQTCDNSVLDELQKEKDKICNSIPGESCSDSKVSPKRLARRPCSQIRLRIKALEDCIRIRETIQQTCFGGKPNPAHQKPLDELNNGLLACRALEAINCAPGHPMANL